MAALLSSLSQFLPQLIPNKNRCFEPSRNNNGRQLDPEKNFMQLPNKNYDLRESIQNQKGKDFLELKNFPASTNEVEEPETPGIILSSRNKKNRFWFSQKSVPLDRHEIQCYETLWFELEYFSINTLVSILQYQYFSISTLVSIL